MSWQPLPYYQCPHQHDHPLEFRPHWSSKPWHLFCMIDGAGAVLKQGPTASTSNSLETKEIPVVAVGDVQISQAKKTPQAVE
jgi:hypothetical protein